MSGDGQRSKIDGSDGLTIGISNESITAIPGRDTRRTRGGKGQREHGAARDEFPNQDVSLTRAKHAKSLPASSTCGSLG
jgi:hypothetical protein